MDKMSKEELGMEPSVGVTMEKIISVNNAMEIVADQEGLKGQVTYDCGKLKARTERVAKAFNKYRRKLLKEADDRTQEEVKNGSIQKSDLISINEFSLSKKDVTKFNEDIEEYLNVKDDEFSIPVFKLKDFEYTKFEKNDDGKEVKVTKNAVTARFVSLMGEFLES